MMPSALGCQVVQSLNHDLPIKSPIVPGNESLSEVFLQANRIFIQVPGNPGTRWKAGDGFEVGSNEILKPLRLRTCSQVRACRF